MGLSCRAIVVGVVIALLAGCGGSQLPTGDMKRRKSVAVAALLALLVLFSQRTAVADNRYPIPFIDEPDMRGFIVNPPASFAAVLRARVMAHPVVLVALNSSTTIDQHKAATLAYQNLFKNASHLPAGPLYVVVMVYGPPNLVGAHPEFGYIFRRDKTLNGWKARLVSEPELDAIHCALGQKILGAHGAC